MAHDAAIEFTRILCGSTNRCTAGELSREATSCANCGSNVRTRGLLRALSLELFGTSVVLPDFPGMKSLRGLGTSDTAQYAALLAEKFDYKNTFHDRPPLLDIMRPLDDELGKYDFVISSEVLEHVPPPVEAPFANLQRLLKPNVALASPSPHPPKHPPPYPFPHLHTFPT